MNKFNSQFVLGALREREGDAGERDEGEGGKEGHRLGKGQAGQNPAEDLRNQLKRSEQPVLIG